ncbi:uncharacterized protein FTOL_09336 [Fusarium torulosum]|uniref:Uncharacterized protein n=1 Tax=Fusarium torulosum TaxID=33205 RepID=A0AAE8MEL4_9HYPO|nr:uncharacterized protein FTOL_09336 [Fusarium torulosum]
MLVIKDSHEFQTQLLIFKLIGIVPRVPVTA